MTPFVKQLTVFLIDTTSLEPEQMHEKDISTVAETVDEIAQEITKWKAESDNKRGKKQGKNSIKDILNKLNKQKTFILKKLKAGRDDLAEAEVGALVHSQHQTGGLNHLCRSLCDLGSRTSELGHFDFALKIFGYAQLADPDDAVTITDYT